MQRSLLRSLLLGSAGLAIAHGEASAQTSSCGELLIVLDRSGSMAECMIDGKPKEQIARAALNTVVDKFASLPMGLFVFPNTLSPDNLMQACTGRGCEPGKIIVDVDAAGSQMVRDYLNVMPMSCGGTPTGDSMLRVRDYQGWPMDNRAKFVLLLTDGQPTCRDDNEGICNGGGSAECANPTKVFDSIFALFQKGIHTFVVGFEGNGSGGCSGGRPFNPATLNKMADFGGEANMEPGATARYYSATNEETLNAALTKILGRVSGATVAGCGASRPPMGGGGGSGGTGGGGGASGGGGSAGQGGGGSSGGQSGGGGRSQRDSAPGCACELGGGAAGPAGTALVVCLCLGAAGGIRSRRRRTRGTP